MLTHHNILVQQRALYDLPRGQQRFEAYLELMKGDKKDDIQLPLSGLNPMGKGHLADQLDDYLAMDLDALAGDVVKYLSKEPVVYEAFQQKPMQTVFVLADDAMGQWTNRITYEYDQLCGSKPMMARGWLVAFLWSSEEPALEVALQNLKAVIYRTAWIAANGFANTLGAILSQEAFVANHLGLAPTHSQEELAYSNHLLQPLKGRFDKPTVIPALFGDQAATSLGYSALGLSKNAGLQVAINLGSEL